MRATTAIVLVVLLGLLGAAGWYAYTGLAQSGEPMPTEGYVALIAGAFFAIGIGVGLMALLFYSSRHGYDDSPRFGNDTQSRNRSNPERHDS